jgi:hypothetical protein
MKTKLLCSGLLLLSGLAFGQNRYTAEVFSQFQVNTEVTFGTNIDFLTSDFSDPTTVATEVTTIKTALAVGNPIPAAFYDPTDTSTSVKVDELKMDIYEPAGDTLAQRPVVVYLHTGNFLPPQVNGGINGTRRDSSVIVACRKLARRGFVAIAPDYRLGWNPLDPSQLQRRAQLLNAVYRAIHDMKELVRVVKADSANLGIDPDKITFLGEGSGGYVALAYSTLDKWSEVELSKFSNPQTGNSFVDSNLVGNIEGLGGSLNLYQDNGLSTDINTCVNLGGALADISWLEAGDPAMLSIHAVRDPFAPFGDGTVVVPTTQDDVVDVSGANVFIPKANTLGNNAAFLNKSFNDPITLAARGRYGVTYNYIYPAPFDTITVSSNAEGLFPVVRPLANQLFNNVGSPWQWWDPNGPIATDTLDPGPPAITYHMAGLASNPNMSSSFGRTYMDTILNYITPRMVHTLDLIDRPEYDLQTKLAVYPNPAREMLRLSSTDPALELQSFEIRDVAGRTALRQSFRQGQRQIDLSRLTPGVYFLHLQTDQGNTVRRLVIE